jgi:hypothetical protein
LKPEDPTIRFVVGTSGAFRASTWRCWAPYAKSDVYVGPRSIAGAYHLSLHESDKWHVGFSGQFKQELVEQGRWVGGSRLVAEFPKPDEIAPGTTLGFRVLVPASAVTIDSSHENLPKDLVWIPPPASERAVEVALLIVRPSVKLTGWPGQKAMSTSLVGHFRLASGDNLWVVHREVAIPVIGPMRGAVTRFVPQFDVSQPIVDSRAIVIVEVDGKPSALMECKVEDRRGDSKVSA